MLVSDQDKFAVLWRPKRVWAIAAIHGDAERLGRLHRQIADQFKLGDRVVYLGNVIGHGAGSRKAVNNLLAFRRAAIAGLGMFANDVAVLRGAQEEMWQKLLQLQFALNPAEVLAWMLDQGVAPVLEAYGGNAQEGLRAARTGAAALARWTGTLRATMQHVPGHVAFMASLRRAAYTEPASGDVKLLFVHAGLDTSRPLTAQNDSFWWASEDFMKKDENFGGFAKVMRGFDQDHPGLLVGQCRMSLDGGCGFGGPLMAACLAEDGEVLDVVEA